MSYAYDGHVSLHRARGLVKALLLIGANLSQVREYRDLFEDLLTKVWFWC
jgi:hypothetical protein